MTDFSGHTVLVTGAAAGIGFGIGAVRFDARGRGALAREYKWARRAAEPRRIGGVRTPSTSRPRSTPPAAASRSAT